MESCEKRDRVGEWYRLSSRINFHWGGQGLQPCWRFWAQSLIACSRVSSLRFYRCAEGCA